MEKSSLNVIAGSWQNSPAWLDLPRRLPARSPFKKDRFVSVRVNRLDVHKAAENRRRQPAFEFWSVLAGALPPIPGAETMGEYGGQDFSRLIDAHACFSGIRRPCGSNQDGDQTVVFVLKPHSYFSYDGRPPVPWMRKRSVAPDLVFLAFVRLDQIGDAESDTGVLTHWQFVDADENDPLLPHDFANRFVKRLW